MSHPTWVCGLKQVHPCWLRVSHRHTLRGCVDWNSHIRQLIELRYSHTLRGCVDWNLAKGEKLVLLWSHPTWVCGLKHLVVAWNEIICVTPYVGVWIETPLINDTDWDKLSHPTWVCGLKQARQKRLWPWHTVTPYVGVWIETIVRAKSGVNADVTPYVGVWIETFPCCTYFPTVIVTPYVGVWIETLTCRI